MRCRDWFFMEIGVGSLIKKWDTVTFLCINIGI